MRNRIWDSSAISGLPITVCRKCQTLSDNRATRCRRRSIRRRFRTRPPRPQRPNRGDDSVSRTMTPAGCGPSQYVLFNSRHRAGRDCDIVSRAHLAAYQADQPDERPTAPDPGKASPRRCRQAWATCSDVVTSERAEIREGRPTTRPAREECMAITTAHKLLTDSWTENVEIVETAVGRFQGRPCTRQLPDRPTRSRHDLCRPSLNGASAVR
jgi:hypothetical protein